jgi:CRP-like cAMP-binding protein
MAEIHIFKSSPDAYDVVPGEVLFAEGDPGDVMYAVVDGEVELTHAGRVVEEVSPGGILGEMALIDTGARSATATARTAARVVRVDQKQFTFLVHEHPTFALQVMRVMAARLRRANVTADS